MSKNTHSLEHSNEKVLILSQDAVLGKALRQLFENEKYESIFSDNPQEIYSLIKEGPVNRVVIDADSPTLSTADIINRLTDDFGMSSENIVVLAGESNDDLLSQVGTLGVRAVMKPINPLTFARQIETGFVLASQQPSGAESRRILFVDDDPQSLFLVAPSLHESGLFEIHLAMGALDGFRRFNAVRPDIAILALRMKELSGPALLKKIIDTTDIRNVDIIFSAEEKDVPELRKLLNLGIKGILRKPIDPKLIVTQLINMLGISAETTDSYRPAEHLTAEVQRIVMLAATPKR